LTEDVAARVVTLPLFPLMTTGQLEEVVEAVKDILQETLPRYYLSKQPAR
jgi:dTDP-4-amino-4,6-dideoxygalactose transaminase